MATQAEIEAGLTAITTQVGKVAAEQNARFERLTAEIARLTEVINQGGDASPGVVAALANVQQALDALDSTIPDAPPA